MPFGVIVMCCMGGCGLMPLSGMVEMSSFWVNTDLKCWFMLAFGKAVRQSHRAWRSSSVPIQE